MKMVISAVMAVLVVVMNLSAQVQPNIIIRPSVSDKSPDVCWLYFIKVSTVGNDYLYRSSLDIDGDSVATDTLIFGCALFDMIRVRQISFSRKGQAYLSADTFPVKDSVTWKRERGYGDSLVLQDSLLYLKLFNPRQGTQFSWLLKEKHVFCSGDTFRLLLDEEPGIYSKAADMPRSYMAGGENIIVNQPQKMILMENGLIPPVVHEQNRAVFDLRGKRHTALNGGPALLIIRPLKDNEPPLRYFTK